MSTSVFPSEVFPLVRAFLVANGYSTTVAAFDKELGKNKVVVDTTVEGDLVEACKDYITAQREKNEKKSKTEKRKAEESTEQDKAKKVKVDKKKEESESSDSDSSDASDASEAESSDSSDSDSSSGSDSDSSSSAESDSESEASSSDADSDSSDSSDSDSEESKSSGSSDSDSSSEEEKDKKANGKAKAANGKEKKDKIKKEPKEEDEGVKEEAKQPNGKTSTPSTPTANGFGNETHASSEKKKNAPYRRVTDDDVNLLKQKFSDNTFESKKGDEYGKAANDILSQVHGKDFRTAKTKKKKGTYKGGKIDLRVNSVKFTFDD